MQKTKPFFQKELVLNTNKTSTHIMKIIRITVDAGMYILFLLLMGYHLFENLHHEILAPF